MEDMVTVHITEDIGDFLMDGDTLITDTDGDTLIMDIHTTDILIMVIHIMGMDTDMATDMATHIIEDEEVLLMLEELLTVATTDIQEADLVTLIAVTEGLILPIEVVLILEVNQVAEIIAEEILQDVLTTLLIVEETQQVEIVQQEDHPHITTQGPVLTPDLIHIEVLAEAPEVVAAVIEEEEEEEDPVEAVADVAAVKNLTNKFY